MAGDREEHEDAAEAGTASVGVAAEAAPGVPPLSRRGALRRMAAALAGVAGTALLGPLVPKAQARHVPGQPAAQPSRRLGGRALAYSSYRYSSYSSSYSSYSSRYSSYSSRYSSYSSRYSSYSSRYSSYSSLRYTSHYSSQGLDRYSSGGYRSFYNSRGVDRYTSGGYMSRYNSYSSRYSSSYSSRYSSYSSSYNSRYSSSYSSRYSSSYSSYRR